ncbi:MAG: nitroreductase family deazaflavin-dependent oxidoreductase [Mycobacteriaceae bacterium]|nr:nitroreductase family deazaflavin-dependent oxidoreductase [Mycobacteriaceae bacterium]
MAITSPPSAGRGRSSPSTPHSGSAFAPDLLRSLLGPLYPRPTVGHHPPSAAPDALHRLWLGPRARRRRPAVLQSKPSCELRAASAAGIDFDVPVERGGVASATVSGVAINGIPRVDPRAHRAAWKRGVHRLAATKPGSVIHRMIAAPLEVPIMKATGVRITSFVLPVAVLTSTGARSGRRRETPVIYFTDGDDVILIASNYGGTRHPGWFHNLVAHPECELRIGRRGGRFLARETEDAERERLFALAVDLYSGYGKYAQRTYGTRTIRTLRLTPLAG